MSSSSHADAKFRTDIAGLRTIAILAVVLVHAGVSWLPGGFVGVDVFFVISGFLITAHLLREVGVSGRVDLFAFWARRLRRLFPALLAVTTVTCILSPLVLSPLELQKLALESAATLLSVANVLFAQQATDYFGHDVQQSPLLHMWSLGVEEQFYLALPILVLTLAFAARRARVSFPALLMGSLGAVLLASISASIYFTTNHPFWAFYTLPTRAWEFAAGGVVAVALANRSLPKSWMAPLVWGGLGLIVLSCVSIQSGQAFPGFIAAFPVAGAAMIIAGGASNAFPSRMLGSPVMVWIGERSYSWYLWHWPAIIFSSALLKRESVWLGLCAVIASLGIAHLSHRWVESPVRYSLRLSASTNATYKFTAGAVLAATLIVTSVYVVGDLESGKPNNRAWAAAYEQSAPNSCPEQSGAATANYCIAGAKAGHKTVMIVGDSHAAQWVPTLSEIAKEEGFRLIIRSLDACPAAQVRVLAHGAPNSACASFQDGTRTLVQEIAPDVLLTANSDSYIGQIADASGKVPSEQQQAALWRNGLEEVISLARDVDATTASIEDTPRPGGNASVCVTRPKGNEESCRPTKAEAFAEISTLLGAERSIDIEYVLSFRDQLCPGMRCLIAEQGTPVFADQSHVSQQWAATQKERLKSFINEALK